MESVYIGTSVVSYLVARPPARTVSRQWHVWTKDWWRLRRPFFECVISAEVLREAAAGDPKASRQRLEALSTLTVLRRTPTMNELMEVFLSTRALRPKAKTEAHGDTPYFLDQMEAGLAEHPHAGPVVNSPEVLQARLRAREATEPLPPRSKPYLVHDPIVAEIHRTREVLYREQNTEAVVLKDEPPRKKH